MRATDLYGYSMKSKCNIRQTGDFDNSSHQVQAACYEHIDGLVARLSKSVDDVDRMFDRWQDVNVFLREVWRKGCPSGGELVLCLQLREVRFRDRLRRQVCRT